LDDVDSTKVALLRTALEHRLIDELLSLFGSKPQPVMDRLFETGQLTLDNVKKAEQLLRELERKDGRNRSTASPLTCW
jgi:hypothetical protein